jgi:CheY-like chemotaxis protein
MNSEIILIEDSESDAEIILRALKKANIMNSVKHIVDGEKALEYFFGKNGDAYQGSCPKFILIDMKMPKVNGLEVIKKLKDDEKTKRIPIIVLTSSNENKDINEAYEHGINSYIVKSADYEHFSKLVVDLATYWLVINQRAI